MRLKFSLFNRLNHDIYRVNQLHIRTSGPACSLGPRFCCAFFSPSPSYANLQLMLCTKLIHLKTQHKSVATSASCSGTKSRSQALPHPAAMRMHRSSSRKLPVGVPALTNSANMSFGSMSSRQYMRPCRPLSMPWTDCGANTTKSPAASGKRSWLQKPSPSPACQGCCPHMLPLTGLCSLP